MCVCVRACMCVCAHVDVEPEVGVGVFHDPTPVSSLSQPLSVTPQWGSQLALPALPGLELLLGFHVRRASVGLGDTNSGPHLGA